MKLFSTLSLMFFCGITLGASTKVGDAMIYVDGNNNSYELVGDSLFYNPVTAKESSSGEYSGGVPSKLLLDPYEKQTILQFVSRLIKDKENLIETRLMGCGTLKRGKKIWYVNMNSSIKYEFEAYLKTVLDFE